MSKPASRLFHKYECHEEGHKDIPGDGLVGAGSMDTFITMLPALRVGDPCICIYDSLSPASEGAAMVLINGLPAVRFEDKSLDGGKLREGEPTVLIGGPTFSVPPFISIYGSDDFRSKTVKHLATIASTESGKKLFASLEKSGKKVTIMSVLLTRDGIPCCTTYPGESDKKLRNVPIDSVVYYDPDQKHQRQTYLTEQENDKAWRNPPGYSSDVTLLHELVHADDQAYGRSYRYQEDTIVEVSPEPGASYQKTSKEYRKKGDEMYCDGLKNTWTHSTYSERCGEVSTVGLCGKSKDVAHGKGGACVNKIVTENSYREERGYPTRDKY